MKIAVIGTGYVGLVTGTCLANLGNNVTCIDVDKNKIALLQKGNIPIYEPGLEEMVCKNIKEKRLFFENNIQTFFDEVDMVFIAVGTPPKENGECDLSFIKDVAKSIGQNIKKYTIIVNKSTVPVGTGDLVTQIIQEQYNGSFDVVSNPEFLREGTAVDDFLNSDRVVLGCDSKDYKALSIMKKLYQPLNCPIVTTDLKSAEMIKYASNAFLATSISFINSIANICEKAGADVNKVSQGMKLDKRIGRNAFLDAGCGYGGSCFPKDVQALIHIGKQNNENFEILEKVELLNNKMKKALFQKLSKAYNKETNNLSVAIWGVSFKPNTDDIRFAPSLELVQNLLDHEIKVNVFDPAALNNFQKHYPNINYFECPYQAAKNVDSTILCTDWDEFKQIDLKRIKESMKGNVFIDGRNAHNPKKMNELGFKYYCIGKKHD